MPNGACLTCKPLYLICKICKRPCNLYVRNILVHVKHTKVEYVQLVEPTADSQFWWVAGLGALAAVGAAAAKGRPASAVADLDSTDLEASIRSEFKK